MRLQLDSSISGPGDTRVNSTGNGTSAQSARVADSAGSRDSISISSTVTALNQAAAERATRIQQLSNAVQAGAYQVSSSATAGAILAQAGS